MRIHTIVNPKTKFKKVEQIRLSKIVLECL